MKAVLGVCGKIDHYSQKDLVMSAAIRALSNTIQMLVKWLVWCLKGGRLMKIVKKKSEKGLKYIIACFCLCSSLSSNFLAAYIVFKQRTRSLD